MKDQVVVDATLHEGDFSPPLTSSLFSRNSASSAQESAYLRQASLLRWARLGLSTLTVGIALAIVGCAGHILHCYNQTHLGVEWHLPLWPVDVDIKPTLGTMIPATIVLVMGLLYLLFAIIPSPRSRTLSQVLLFLGVSSTAFTLTIFAVFFNQLLLYYFDLDRRETLQTWTCKFYYGAKEFQKASNELGVPINGEPLIPEGFKRLCMESQAASWMSVGLLVVEIVCFIVAVWGHMAERKIKRSRDERYRSGKCESEFQ